MRTADAEPHVRYRRHTDLRVPISSMHPCLPAPYRYERLCNAGNTSWSLPTEALCLFHALQVCRRQGMLCLPIHRYAPEEIRLFLWADRILHRAAVRAADPQEQERCRSVRSG